MPGIRRREIITLLGGEAAWLIAVRAHGKLRFQRLGSPLDGLARNLEPASGISERTERG